MEMQDAVLSIRDAGRGLPDQVSDQSQQALIQARELQVLLTSLPFLLRQI